jgi:hypothetical protein
LISGLTFRLAIVAERIIFITVPMERRIGWAFWLQWVLANALAWLVGAALIVPVSYTIFNLLADARIMYFSYEVASSYIYGSMIGGAIYGVLIGAMQWFVLHHYIHRLLLSWMVLSILGWALGAGVLAYGAATFSNDLLAPGVRGVVLGAIVGALQWLVLRRYAYHAGWWVLMVGIGWGLSSLAYSLFEGILGSTLANADPPILGGISGAVFGAITGLVMMWLLNHPKQQIVNG